LRDQQHFIILKQLRRGLLNRCGDCGDDAWLHIVSSIGMFGQTRAPMLPLSLLRIPESLKAATISIDGLGHEPDKHHAPDVVNTGSVETTIDEPEIDVSQASDKGDDGFAQAMINSKLDCDTPPLSGDDVVLFRLTYTAKWIIDLLVRLLPAQVSRVEDAGCILSPSFANGALLLVPCTESQFSELGIQTGAHNILGLRLDKEPIKRVLSTIRKRARPGLHPETHLVSLQSSPQPATDSASAADADKAVVGDLVAELANMHLPAEAGCSNHQAASSAFDALGSMEVEEESGDDLDLVEVPVRNTFVHYPHTGSIAEDPNPATSDPGSVPAPINPRRWVL